MPDQFWDLTMRDFRVMQKGYLQRLEDEQMHHWDLLRTMATYVLQPHLKNGRLRNEEKKRAICGKKERTACKAKRQKVPI
jgi:hypothetical protein